MRWIYRYAPELGPARMLQADVMDDTPVTLRKYISAVSVFRWGNCRD